MSNATWVETLVSSQVDSTAVTNSTTQATMLPGHAIIPLPANYFYVGRSLRIKAFGRISNTVTAVTLTTVFSLASTVSTVNSVLNSGAITLVARATTNVSWELDATLTCRSIGAAGANSTMLGIGCFTSEACAGSSANIATSAMFPLSAPATSTFDNTIVNYANLWATWGTAAAGNSITTHLYTLESMN